MPTEWMLPAHAVLLLLLPCCPASHPRVPEAVEVEHYPEAHTSTSHIILLSFTAGMVVVAIGALVGFLRARSILPLPAFLFVAMFVAVLVDGTVVWAVNYTATHKVIEDRVNTLLLAKGDEIQVSITNSLNGGVQINEATASLVATGSVSPARGYPRLHRYFQNMLRTVAVATPSLEMLFTADVTTGVAQGVHRTVNGTWTAYVGLQVGESPPEGIVCRAEPSQCNETCSSCEEDGPSPCDVSCSCAEACTSQTSSRLLRTAFPVLDPQPVQHLARFSLANLEVGQVQDFDTTSRVWFTSETEVRWTPPYIFVTGGGKTLGLTSTIGVWGPGGGVTLLGADYSLTSLSEELRFLPPTRGAVILLAHPSTGVLVAGSMAIKEMVYVTNTSNPAVRSPFSIITRRFGSLSDALHTTAILQGEGTVVLSKPVPVRGGLTLLMAISIPHGDILEDVHDASTTALGLAIAISIMCGVLLSIAVALMLRPLEELVDDMDRVAWMKLENLPHRTSRIREVRSMQVSFQHMVRNLREFRNFIPPAILESGAASEDDDGSTSSTTILTLNDTPSSDSHRPVPPTSGPSSAFGALFRKKQVTLIAANIRGFHRLTRSLSLQDLVDLHSEYLETVALCVGELRGMVDGFSGDRVLASFNATRPCVVHRQKAPRAALRIREAMRNVPREEDLVVDITCGVSGGEIMVGTMGCDGLKNQCHIGRVSSTVRTLERLAAMWDAGIVVDPAVVADSEGIFELRRTELTLLPQRETPVMLNEVMAVRESSLDAEWLYDLLHPTPPSLYAPYNAAVDFLYEGKYTEALQSLGNSLLGAAYDNKLRMRIVQARNQDPYSPPPPFSPPY